MTYAGPGRALSALAPIFLLLPGAGPAFAQDKLSASSEEITVTAPRTVTERVRRKDRASRGQAMISVQLGVLYGDLDLTQPGDAARLMERVDLAARDACRYLDRLYPLDPDKHCAERAIAETRPLAQSVVDEAVYRQSGGR